jgi:hypothetical protein
MSRRDNQTSKEHVDGGSVKNWRQENQDHLNNVWGEFVQVIMSIGSC